MSRLFLILACSFSICFLNSCKEDASEKFDYQVSINKPDAEDKKVGDSMHIHVDFESKTGEIVHNVNVRIYNKETNEEVYNAPSDSHEGHESHGDEESKHEHHDDFELTTDNGIAGHSDYILEAKVWAHEAGEAEVVEMVEFHVHPE